MYHTDFMDFNALALHKNLNIKWEIDIQGRKVQWSDISVIDVDLAHLCIWKIMTSHAQESWNIVKMQRFDIYGKKSNTLPGQTKKINKSAVARKFNDFES